MNQRICLFPGSFDPLTLGHVDIIERAMHLFDRLVIGIGSNSSKQAMFSVEQRAEWIRQVFIKEPKVSVQVYKGLTVDFCKEIDARYILRGIRYVSDFEYERAIADMNRSLAPELETIFLTSSAQHATISSTLVRDVIRNGGNARQFLPEAVQY
ncbi:pantetheine-phosphate adenylyltransferase [Rurimicrobium arvi]|uniref:Phosphopantetheine adenylyltransferase n=1 Tax=Rurimicrobium arvi TaxID=2049916 RepID=A0ABP8MNA2_9BACT